MEWMEGVARFAIVNGASLLGKGLFATSVKDAIFYRHR